MLIWQIVRFDMLHLVYCKAYCQMAYGLVTMRHRAIMSDLEDTCSCTKSLLILATKVEHPFLHHDVPDQQRIQAL